MKYLRDKIDTLSKQSVSAAAITDSNGKQVGKVFIRFTDSYIGWNHEVCVIVYGDGELHGMNSRKGGCYDKPATLYFMLRDAGYRVFNRTFRIGDYQDKTLCNYDSLSRFEDISHFKKGNKVFNLLWVV